MILIRQRIIQAIMMFLVKGVINMKVNNELNGVIPGFGDEERKFYEGISSMIKLRVESKLFSDINVVLDSISKKFSMYKGLGRHAIKIRNRALRRMDRSYRQGLREIDKNIPVFVELPKYEKRGNGYTENKPGEKREDEEIIMNDLLTGPAQGAIEINDKTEVLTDNPPAGLIEG